MNCHIKSQCHPVTSLLIIFSNSNKHTDPHSTNSMSSFYFCLIRYKLLFLGIKKKGKHFRESRFHLQTFSPRLDLPSKSARRQQQMQAVAAKEGAEEGLHGEPNGTRLCICTESKFPQILQSVVSFQSFVSTKSTIIVWCQKGMMWVVFVS